MHQVIKYHGDKASHIPKEHEMAVTSPHEIASSVRPGGWSLRGFLQLRALHRQRQQLAKLDDAALRDIGITRSEALAEASRPFWDAPPHWICSGR